MEIGKYEARSMFKPMAAMDTGPPNARCFLMFRLMIAFNARENQITIPALIANNPE